MELNERQQQIYALLQEKKSLRVKELARTLYVAEMTIRRDLTEMESAGYLHRYHGGAVLPDERFASPIILRRYEHDTEKRRLAKRASAWLSDGISVFLDSSSTTAYLIPHLTRYRGLSVFTNSVYSSCQLAEQHIPHHLLGGDYLEQDMCTVGSVTEEEASRLNVDVAFFSIYAMTDDGLLTDYSALQQAVRRRILENAKAGVFLLESVKIHCPPSLYTLCRAEDVAAVLTPENDPLSPAD